jgi:hypothetical protein
VILLDRIGTVNGDPEAPKAQDKLSLGEAPGKIIVRRWRYRSFFVSHS